MERLDLVREQLRQFAGDREWEQFHTPRNLAMALAGEVGELLSLMQWVRSEDMAEWLADASNATALRHEIADVFAYLLQLADATGVDPVQALAEKIEINTRRYPIDAARGSAAKYTDFEKKGESE